MLRKLGKKEELQLTLEELLEKLKNESPKIGLNKYLSCLEQGILKELDLSCLEQRILEELVVNPYLLSKDLAKKIDITEEMIKKLFKSLSTKGILLCPSLNYSTSDYYEFFALGIDNLSDNNIVFFEKYELFPSSSITNGFSSKKLNNSAIYTVTNKKIVFNSRILALKVITDIGNVSIRTLLRMIARLKYEEESRNYRQNYRQSVFRFSLSNSNKLAGKELINLLVISEKEFSNFYDKIPFITIASFETINNSGNIKWFTFLSILPYDINFIRKIINRYINLEKKFFEIVINDERKQVLKLIEESVKLSFNDLIRGSLDERNEAIKQLGKGWERWESIIYVEKYLQENPTEHEEIAKAFFKSLFEKKDFLDRGVDNSSILYSNIAKKIRSEAILNILEKEENEKIKIWIIEFLIKLKIIKIQEFHTNEQKVAALNVLGILKILKLQIDKDKNTITSPNLLSNLENHKTVELMINLLKTRDNEVKENVIRVLGLLDPSVLEKILEPLILTMLDEEDNKIRKMTIGLLMKFKRNVMETLMTLVEQERITETEKLIVIHELKLWNIADITKKVLEKEMVNPIDALEALVRLGDKDSLQKLYDIHPQNQYGYGIYPTHWDLNDVEKAYEALVRLDKEGFIENHEERLIESMKYKLREVTDDNSAKVLLETYVNQLKECKSIKAILCFLDPDQFDDEISVKVLANSNNKDILSVLKQELTNDWRTRILIQLLKNKDKDIRKIAVETLGKLHDNTAVDPLIEVLKDENEEIRKTASYVLRFFGDKCAVEPLIQTLEDKNSDVRKQAIDSLGFFRDRRALEPLIETLKDKDPSVRLTTIDTFWQFSDIKIINPLIEVLKDENEEVRKTAIHTLGLFKYYSTSIPHIKVQKDGEEKLIAINTFDSLRDFPDMKVIDSLIKSLKDENKEVRKTTIGTLKHFPDKKVIDSLIEELKDENWELKMAIAYVLIDMLCNLRVVEPLRHALEDETDFQTMWVICYILYVLD